MICVGKTHLRTRVIFHSLIYISILIIIKSKVLNRWDSSLNHLLKAKADILSTQTKPERKGSTKKERSEKIKSISPRRTSKTFMSKDASQRSKRWCSKKPKTDKRLSVPETSISNMFKIWKNKTESLDSYWRSLNFVWSANN